MINGYNDHKKIEDITFNEMTFSIENIFDWGDVNLIHNEVTNECTNIEIKHYDEKLIYQNDDYNIIYSVHSISPLLPHREQNLIVDQLTDVKISTTKEETFGYYYRIVNCVLELASFAIGNEVCFIEIVANSHVFFEEEE